MALPRLSIDGLWFREPSGRRVLLRGVNLGGDCKVPTRPDGRTDLPTDFSDHREVSFVGRPFPLHEAEGHFARLRHWGFNCLRLLTTWEAVEHAGPGQYDEAYLDYFADIVRLAGEHGFYVFIDFHQDAWSRMSGGDGAPGWTFESAGLDFTKFDEADAAIVMQHKYDRAIGGRQDSYPQMCWSQNYRGPANAVMWTLFFAGDAFAPEMRIGGLTAQGYLQAHYLGAMQRVAERLKDMDHVLGFDTLNEPSLGWIGKPLTQVPGRVPGLRWSVLDALLVADGESRDIPYAQFDWSDRKMKIARTQTVNPNRIRLWMNGADNPFAAAYRAGEKEDYFQTMNGGDIQPETDFMAPFFNAVATTIREVRPDWLVFGEMSPFDSFRGSFPPGCPPNMVNATHWYDINTLLNKSFHAEDDEDRESVRRSYVSQLSHIKEMSEKLPGGGAPGLVGEFGIPFDLDEGAAYEAWAGGERGPHPWADHIDALSLMYDALDELLLHSTQWNYTASNRNDLAIGDGWNQEDLSIYSVDQADPSVGLDSGGRAVAGFVRPYVRLWAGRPVSQSFERASGTFRAELTIEQGVGPVEIFAPRLVYPDGPAVLVEGPGKAEYDREAQLVRVHSRGEALMVITLKRN